MIEKYRISNSVFENKSRPITVSTSIHTNHPYSHFLQLIIKKYPNKIKKNRITSELKSYFVDEVPLVVDLYASFIPTKKEKRRRKPKRNRKKYKNECFRALPI